MKSADGYSLQRICRPQEEQGWNSEVHWERWLEKDKEGWKAVKRWIWGQELRCGGLKGISGCRNSESVLATVVNTSNPCLLGNTHIVLGVWPGKVKGYEIVFRWLHLNLSGQRDLRSLSSSLQVLLLRGDLRRMDDWKDRYAIKTVPCFDMHRQPPVLRACHHASWLFKGTVSTEVFLGRALLTCLGSSSQWPTHSLNGCPWNFCKYLFCNFFAQQRSHHPLIRPCFCSESSGLSLPRENWPRILVISQTAHKLLPSP